MSTESIKCQNEQKIPKQVKYSNNQTIPTAGIIMNRHTPKEKTRHSHFNSLLTISVIAKRVFSACSITIKHNVTATVQIDLTKNDEVT